MGCTILQQSDGKAAKVKCPRCRAEIVQCCHCSYNVRMDDKELEDEWKSVKLGCLAWVKRHHVDKKHRPMQNDTEPARRMSSKKMQSLSKKIRSSTKAIRTGRATQSMPEELQNNSSLAPIGTEETHNDSLWFPLWNEFRLVCQNLHVAFGVTVFA